MPGNIRLILAREFLLRLVPEFLVSSLGPAGLFPKQISPVTNSSFIPSDHFFSPRYSLPFRD